MQLGKDFFLNLNIKPMTELNILQEKIRELQKDKEELLQGLSKALLDYNVVNKLAKLAKVHPFTQTPKMINDLIKKHS